MTNEEFIAIHLYDDVQAVALGNTPAGIDIRHCLQQITGQQASRSKLPTWARTAGILFPARLAMEQCSSEVTALYKQQLVEHLLPKGRQNMVDLTGGFGSDFTFLG